MNSSYQIKQPSKLLNGSSAVITFPESAKKVTVFDNRGRPLWTGVKVSANAVLEWDARNSKGDRVGAGSYTCKIEFLDAQIIYVPFVFIG
jgi:hypothetical protein